MTLTAFARLRDQSGQGHETAAISDGFLVLLALVRASVCTRKVLCRASRWCIAFESAFGPAAQGPGPLRRINSASCCSCPVPGGGGFGLRGPAIGEQEGSINVICLGPLTGCAGKTPDRGGVQNSDGHVNG
jgi:hypothetical protein